MGCGASAQCQQPPLEEGQKAEIRKEDAKAPATWATKTDVAAADVPPNAQGSSTLPGRLGEAFLLDADEELEEIEVIQEATPKYREMNKRTHDHDMLRTAAANGQEAPQVDTEYNGNHQTSMPAQPLSKQQMEEAAKLAERRKRFDNQRYQREQHIPYVWPGGDRPGGYEVIPFDSPVGSHSPQPAKNRSPPLLAPAPAVAMGLSLTVSRDAALQGDYLDGGVPGGIIDESDRLKAYVGPKKKKNQHEHDTGIGFDADEERLMMKILEESGDI